jgi:hypothetical protein
MFMIRSTPQTKEVLVRSLDPAPTYRGERPLAALGLAYRSKTNVEMFIISKETRRAASQREFKARSAAQPTDSVILR